MGTSEDIATRINTIQTMMDKAISDANEFLNTMKVEMQLGYEPIAPPQGWFTPATITVDAEKPSRPDMGMTEIAVPGDMAAMPEFSEPFPAEEVLTIPRDLTFTEQEYVSSILDAVKAKLLADVQSGGTGLGAAIEQDIWDRQSERDLQVYRDAVDRKISEWSSRGFTMPNDVIDARLEELDDKFRMTILDKSREIAIKQAELAQTNTHFVITSSLTLENMTLAHHENLMNRALDAGKAIVDAGVAILNAMILRYNARLEAYKTGAITFTELEKQKLEYHIARTNRWKAQVEAQIARVRGLTDVYQADTQVYSAEIGKAEAVGRIRVAQQEMQVNQSENSMKIKLDAARANLEAFIQNASVKNQAVVGGANVYAHLAASAVNALSVILQMVESTTKTG